MQILYIHARIVHGAAHMSMKKLDAITVMPRLLTLDFWTAVTMPMITVFLNTVYSASKVNDPSKSTGYFYGSFFIINANVYDEIALPNPRGNSRGWRFR